VDAKERIVITSGRLNRDLLHLDCSELNVGEIRTEVHSTPSKNTQKVRRCST
jgi:hypothetical protein